MFRPLGTVPVIREHRIKFRIEMKMVSIFCSLVVPELGRLRQQPGCIRGQGRLDIDVMFFRQVCFEAVRS